MCLEGAVRFRLPMLSIILFSFLAGAWLGAVLVDRPVQWEPSPVAPVADTPTPGR